MVDDGYLTHSEGGIEYESGPIKCVKDCPACGDRRAPTPAAVAQPPEATMRIGDGYNWKHAERDHLIYLGKKGAWHQFKKIGDPREVWCEVLGNVVFRVPMTSNQAYSARKIPSSGLDGMCWQAPLDSLGAIMADSRHGYLNHIQRADAHCLDG